MRVLMLGAIFVCAFLGLYCWLFGEMKLAAWCAVLGVVGVVLDQLWARVVGDV